tara:strand:- start:47 stop:379 length:333 start_codon:yes stop_codon:yes gene_type:complete
MTNLNKLKKYYSNQLEEIYILSQDLEKSIAYFSMSRTPKSRKIDLYIEIKEDSFNDFELNFELFQVRDVSAQYLPFGNFAYMSLKVLDSEEFGYIEDDDIISSIISSYIV